MILRGKYNGAKMSTEALDSVYGYLYLAYLFGSFYEFEIFTLSRLYV